MRPYLSVVIPIYNLGSNYKDSALDNVENYLSKQKYSWEVILVNDGSEDDTKEVLDSDIKTRRNFKLISIAHGGKAAAVSAGVMLAAGQIILFTDFDQSTPIEEFTKFKTEFDSGADIVIAERVREKKQDKFISKARSKAFNILVQLIVLPGIEDSQCGFKAFKGEVGKYLFSNLQVTKPKKVNGPYMGAFDVELLYLGGLKRYKIKSVEVKWIREDSNNLKWSEPIKMLVEVLKIRLYYSSHPVL
jgi:dolichyl-phosphate beta-glucosyltransferase